MTTVSPAFSPAFRRLVRTGHVKCVRRRYARNDVPGNALVIAATDDPQVNARVGVDARRARILANIVDAPAASDFIVSAVVHRGDLLIAISTGGASPGLAARLRHLIEALVPAEYGTVVGVLGATRDQCSERWRVEHGGGC